MRSTEKNEFLKKARSTQIHAWIAHLSHVSVKWWHSLELNYFIFYERELRTCKLSRPLSFFLGEGRSSLNFQTKTFDNNKAKSKFLYKRLGKNKNEEELYSSSRERNNFLSGSVGRIWPIRQKKRKRSVTSFSTQASYQFNVDMESRWLGSPKWNEFRIEKVFVCFFPTPTASSSSSAWCRNVNLSRFFLGLASHLKSDVICLREEEIYTIHVPMTKITTQSRTDEFISPF